MNFSSISDPGLNNRFISETLYDSAGSGNYDIPDSASILWIDICAGGGGGGPAYTSNNTSHGAGGQGGQSGGAASLLVQLDSTSDNIAYSVGAGGTGGQSIIDHTGTDDDDIVGTVGDSGDNSSFGGLVTCIGGRYGQSAEYSTSSPVGDYAGGDPDNSQPFGQNNPNLADGNRRGGVIIDPTWSEHLVTDYIDDLGYAPGGKGRDGSTSDTAEAGGRAGLYQARAGTNAPDNNRNDGGGGGSTYFGLGGYGSTASNDSDNCRGDNASIGFGGGGGGAGSRWSSGLSQYFIGDGGNGKNGFIRIRAYK